MEKNLHGLFNKCLFKGITHETRHKKLFCFFKKGDTTEIENYRSISLLSHIFRNYLQESLQIE